MEGMEMRSTALFATYYEMDDGTWMYDGRNYKYHLEISGLSSNLNDYFKPEEAVFVGWKVDK